ncbi:MAG: hypothetical protein MJA82_09140 [Clostridia bacterium]|nr:hypothetical protein [Clostridia bacterium]
MDIKKSKDEIEILPKGSVELDISQLTDIKEILEKEYQKDILFEKLCGTGKKEDIFTDKMIEELNMEELYSTGDAAVLLDEKRSTISTWVKVLIDYIDPQMDGRNYKLDYESIFKLRMVAMLRVNNQYTITKIKEMTSDIEVINPNLELKKEKEKPLNVRVKEVEDKTEKVEELEDKLEHIGKALGVLLRGIDEEVLIQLQRGEDPSKILPKFKQELLPKPQVTSEDVKKIVESEINIANEELRESVKEELRKELEEEMKRQEEQRLSENEKLMNAIENIRNKKKGFWERLFGK